MDKIFYKLKNIVDAVKTSKSHVDIFMKILKSLEKTEKSIDKYLYLSKTSITAPQMVIILIESDDRKDINKINTSISNLTAKFTVINTYNDFYKFIRSVKYIKSKIKTARYNVLNALVEQELMCCHVSSSK